jgi:hypothetical protein
MAQDWSPDRHIDAMAPLLGLEVTDAQRPGVRRFLEVARAMADVVERAIPPDTLDLAPVFVPVPPPDVDAER